MLSPAPTSSRIWFGTRRAAELEGELRTAALRIVMITVCFAVQLAHYRFYSDRGGAATLYQQQMTGLSVCWLLVSLAVLVIVRRRWFPPAFKYVTTSVDFLLLTVAAGLASGPTSPLLLLYPVLIAMAGLRFSLGLVWYSTLVSFGCYAVLVGGVDPHWFDAEHTTPLVQQAIAFTGLLAAGLVTGQVVRLAERIAERYARQYAALKPVNDERVAKVTR